MSLKTLASLDVRGKRILLRCDLNVPIKDGVITDAGRIEASLPTIRELINQGCSIVIVAHLGRPKGETKPELSLAPVATRLGEFLGKSIKFIPKIRGALPELKELQPGQIAMLENIRFESAETSKDDSDRFELATELATYGDIFISDGFGAVHRKHASVYDVAKLLPHGAGELVSAEVRILSKLIENPDRPFGVVLGGAKVSDKLAVIDNLLEKVDLLVIGGGMVFTFLAAQGNEIGKSLLEAEQIENVKAIFDRAAKLGVKLLLPVDIVVAPEFSNDAIATIVTSSEIPPNQIGLDIGPKSAELFAHNLLDCKTVFWNGPMGVFELPKFANGTKVVAQALTKIAGLSVVGGGDSAAAVRKLGFKDSQFGYISTGGGASLEYLEGKELPGLKALE